MIFNYGALRAARRAQKLHQTDVAAVLHCTASTISHLENEHTKITAETFGILCDLYAIENINSFFVKGLPAL